MRLAADDVRYYVNRALLGHIVDELRAVTVGEDAHGYVLRFHHVGAKTAALEASSSWAESLLLADLTWHTGVRREFVMTDGIALARLDHEFIAYVQGNNLVAAMRHHLDTSRGAFAMVPGRANHKAMHLAVIAALHGGTWPALREASFVYDGRGITLRFCASGGRSPEASKAMADVQRRLGALLPGHIRVHALLMPEEGHAGGWTVFARRAADAQPASVPSWVDARAVTAADIPKRIQRTGSKLRSVYRRVIGTYQDCDGRLLPTTAAVLHPCGHGALVVPASPALVPTQAPGDRWKQKRSRATGAADDVTPR